MNVTREVVKDLLPLYASGEASPDSRKLVEAFLRQDPELASLAEAIRSDESAPAPGPVPHDGAHAALLRAKTLLRRRTWLLATALFFSALPLSFVAGNDGLRFLLARDAPALASASWATAVALWIAYLWTLRRTRATGL